MRPIPEKLEEMETLYSSGCDVYKPLILEKLIKRFPKYDFQLDNDLGILYVGAGLSNADWHILYGYCLAWEEILEK